MDINLSFLKQKFPDFEKEILEEMLLSGIIKEISEGTEVIRFGQYIKMLPVVIDGVVKVYTQYEDKEFLLYYIKPKESCIMSLSAVLNNTPSKIFALAGQDSVIMMCSADFVKKWVKNYETFNRMFYNLYDNKYSELIETLNQVLFKKLDSRIYDYLLNKSEVSGLTEIQVTHKIIAEELGTAREVVSRILKKLETGGRIEQRKGYIKILK